MDGGADHAKSGRGACNLDLLLDLRSTPAETQFAPETLEQEEDEEETYCHIIGRQLLTVGALVDGFGGNIVGFDVEVDCRLPGPASEVCWSRSRTSLPGHHQPSVDEPDARVDSSLDGVERTHTKNASSQERPRSRQLLIDPSREAFTLQIVIVAARSADRG